MRSLAECDAATQLHLAKLCASDPANRRCLVAQSTLAADCASILVQASPTSSLTSSAAKPLPAPGFARRSLAAGFAAAGAPSTLSAASTAANDQNGGAARHFPAAGAESAATTLRAASDAAALDETAGNGLLAASPRREKGAPRHAPKSLTPDKPRTRSRAALRAASMTAESIDTPAAEDRQPLQEAAAPMAGRQQQPQRKQSETSLGPDKADSEAAAPVEHRAAGGDDDGDGFESADSDGGGYASAAESVGADSAASSASAAASARAATLAAELAKLQRENARLRRSTVSVANSLAASAANSAANSPAKSARQRSTAASTGASLLQGASRSMADSAAASGGSYGDDSESQGAAARAAELDARAAAIAAENAQLKRSLAEAEAKRQARTCNLSGILCLQGHCKWGALTYC